MRHSSVLAQQPGILTTNVGMVFEIAFQQMGRPTAPAGCVAVGDHAIRLIASSGDDGRPCHTGSAQGGGDSQ